MDVKHLAQDLTHPWRIVLILPLAGFLACCPARPDRGLPPFSVEFLLPASWAPFFLYPLVLNTTSLTISTALLRPTLLFFSKETLKVWHAEAKLLQVSLRSWQRRNWKPCFCLLLGTLFILHDVPIFLGLLVFPHLPQPISGVSQPFQDPGMLSPLENPSHVIKTLQCFIWCPHHIKILYNFMKIGFPCQST